jgi:hypothetical protein
VWAVTRRCRRYHPEAASMAADVGGQEDVATVDLTASSSVTEASCVVPIDAGGASYGFRERRRRSHNTGWVFV